MPASTASIISRRRARRLEAAATILSALDTELTQLAYSTEAGYAESARSVRALSRVAGQCYMAAGVIRAALISMSVYLDSAEADAALFPGRAAERELEAGS